MKKLLLAGLLATSLHVQASSQFFVVVPIPAKSTVAGNIKVALAGYVLPDAVAGQPYDGFDFKPLLTVTGDASYSGSGVRWRVVDGSLPAGLTLNSNGTLSGTPSSSGSSSFQVMASYKTKAGQQAYQLFVANIEVSLAAGAPPQAIVGLPYGYALQPLLSVTGDRAYNGAGVKWSVLSSTLPAGLYLTSDGWIGGTPTAAGTGTLTARATYKGVNGQQTYQVLTLAVGVGLASATPPQGIVGQAYSYDVKPLLTITGDAAYTGPGQVSWNVASGALPAGLSLGADGVISGTPTAAASGPVTLQASYRGVDGQQTYQMMTLAITVGLAAGAPPQAIVGLSYRYDLKQLLSVTGDRAYAGGGAGVSWAMLSSTLPAGLYLTSDGWIGGTPTAAGTGTLTARATYRGVNGQQTYQVVTLAIGVVLAPAAPPQGIVGQAYSFDVKPLLTVGGDPDYTGPSQVSWSVASGSLPAGLSLTSAGVISGTPTAVANAPVTLQATYRGVNGQQTYQLLVLVMNVALASGTPPQGVVGHAYTYDVKPLLSVTGDPAYTGAGQATWSLVSGNLPAGLALTPAGVISGTPTAASNGQVTLQASYRGVAGQQTYQMVTLAINVALSAGAPPLATTGKSYSYDLKPLLSVTGDSAYAGNGAGVTWSAVASSLPAGLSLGANGTIAGTPTAAATGSVTARATYRGISDQRTYSVSAYGQSATVSASSLSFPATHSGASSAAQTVTLTNNGSVPVDVSAPSVPSQFSGSSTCASSLAAGASCTVSTAFAPTSGGTKSGTVTIPTGAGNKTVSVSGYAQTYQYVSSGYYEQVPHTSQVECDWHNTYSYTTYGVNPPDQCNGYTSSVRWQLQSQWYDCHGTLKQNDVWQQTCQYQAGQGGQTAVKYETVTTYTQQWVDTSYWAWQ